MTRDELAELIAENTWSFKCSKCGKAWLVPKASGVAILMHECEVPTYGIRRIPDREQDRQTWARALLGEALSDAVEARDGEDGILRRLG